MSVIITHYELYSHMEIDDSVIVGGNKVSDKLTNRKRNKSIMKQSPETKAFNATREGQQSMCADAASKSTAFMMNKIIKQKGGIGWDNQMIETANPILLRAIKENLIEEYNALVGPSKAV